MRYHSSNVQQSLAVKKLNADVQIQADVAILQSHNSYVGYSPHSDCSTVQPRS